MARLKDTVRVSSKGQVVLPADVRRELGLVSGRQLRLTREGTKIILTPVEATGRSSATALRKIRSAARAHSRDGVQELHERRRRERDSEGRRAARGH
jgi:AbrB family looped-hinge helix DNA binding protein